MERIVIDTDPGVDDAHAIMLAFAHPGAKVAALTTVAGNVSLELATRNALIILDIIGQDVPVYAGCDDALVRPTPRRASSHGADGLGDSGFAPSARRASAEHAVQALIRMANESPGQLTLAAIGPLTNIALATRLDPRLPQKYKRLVVMGGAIYAQGNSWERAAEFNIYCDPEAAAIVFDRWPAVTVVPWETALAHGLKPPQVEALARGTSPRADLFRRTIRKHFVELAPGQPVLAESDPLALAVALEPAIIKRAERRYVEIELAGQLTRGQTVVDWYDQTGRPHNAHLILEVDRERFFELMQLSLS
jgi:inosine-uridine nucleoside N-ribohydrolase